MELILTGATSSATEMQSLGVVNKAVSEEEDVLEVATTMARTIASFSAPAIGLAKQAVLAGENCLTFESKVTKLTESSGDDNLASGVRDRACPVL
jgi:enoyl-CoA hydratase/carnithine racemase